MTTINTFAERLTELRENSGKKRQEVADDICISRASLEYYEKGKRKPDIEVLLKLADYYGVTCDYLLKGVKTENIKIHEATGLSDKAIETLQRFIKLSKGGALNYEYEKEINRYEDFLKSPEAYQRYIYGYGEADKEYTFEKWISKANERKLEEIEYFKISSEYEGKIVLSTLNDLLEKEDFFDFMLSLYIYLYAEIKTPEGEINAALYPEHYNSGVYTVISLKDEIVNEAYLLKINNYLRKWQNKGKAVLSDIEVYNNQSERDFKEYLAEKTKDGENNGNNT